MDGQLKNRSKFFSLALLILALVFTGLTAAELMQITGGNNQDSPITAEILDQIRPDKQTVQQYLAQYQQAADQLARNNSFVLPVRAEPPGDCTAIFGDEACFGGRWIRAGDTLGDAKVLDVGPTAVTLQWQGQRMTRSPGMVAADTRKSSSGNQSTKKQQNLSELEFADRVRDLLAEGKITQEHADRTLGRLGIIK